jgi:hypothetical protein
MAFLSDSRHFLSRSGYLLSALLAVSFLFTFSHVSAADSSGPTEYEVKAAFLFNFAKFIEWPVVKTGTPSSPFVLGIYGDDPFGEDMDRTVQGKTVNGHPFTIKRVKPDRPPPDNCHIVFVSGSERRRVEKLLEGLKGSATLTVSEIDQFCERGGMINFRMEANKVRFEINRRAAEADGLRLSSKLLSVALKVVGP